MIGMWMRLLRSDYSKPLCRGPVMGPRNIITTQVGMKCLRCCLYLQSHISSIMRSSAACNLTVTSWIGLVQPRVLCNMCTSAGFTAVFQSSAEQCEHCQHLTASASLLIFNNSQYDCLAGTSCARACTRMELLRSNLFSRSTNCSDIFMQ